MRRLVLAGVLIGFTVAAWPEPVSAGSYTVTTTAQQDAVLNDLLTRINAQRTARGEPALTADQLFQQLIRTAIGQYVAEYRQATRTSACTAYQALSAADQNAIVTQLGGKSPCP